MFKFNKAAAQSRAENRVNSYTGHDQFVRPPVSEKKAKHIMKKLQKQNGLKRWNSAIDIDVSALTAGSRSRIYSCNRSVSSEQENSEHSEKSPLVNERLDNLAKLFSKSMPAESRSRHTIDSVLITRPNLKYQYSALDVGNGVMERSPRERAYRDQALHATQEWIRNSKGRYEIIAHLDEIGSRRSKNWFLVNDFSVRTDRLMTLLPLPTDYVALYNLPQNGCSRGIFMELLGSLHHPYIYPVLDLDFLRIASTNYACLVTPFNSRGCLKDLIYKAQWNEPWVRKYTRKPCGLPSNQIKRLGRQILEALLFLKERGFPLHGHLHSGNVILQNGAARLSGVENGLLGLSSRVNAVLWSRSTTEIENIDIVCFGHLLYEMCTGVELTTPKPSMRMLEMELDSYPQILEILGLIFDPPAGVRPSVEELVLCDLFRSIDLRELRGPCFSTIKPSLSRSTLNLLKSVKKLQCASLSRPLSESSSPCTLPSTSRDQRSGICSSTKKLFDISNHSEERLDEIFLGQNKFKQNPLDQHLEVQLHPIDYCENTFMDMKSFGTLHQQQNDLWFNSSTKNNSDMSLETIENSKTAENIFNSDESIQAATSSPLVLGCKEKKDFKATTNKRWSEITEPASMHLALWNGSVTSTSIHFSSSHALTASSFNHQLTTDLCSYNNSKSRRMEYSLKCLKYRRSNPSQDSAFGSLTDADLSTGLSTFRLSSFQSISSPIDEGIENVIATTTAVNEGLLEIATISKIMISQDSATSSPCREFFPINFVDGSAGSFIGDSSCSNSTVNARPQQFLDSFSPKVLVTTNFTINSINSLQTSENNAQQFDPPKILVNSQNSIYTTSPSKRSSTIEVFSQKYRVSSFEDMSSKASECRKHWNNCNQLKVYRSLEEERRIDSAFKPIRFDRTNSGNSSNKQSDKYKKLTHASFRISKTSNENNESNEISSVCDTYTNAGQPGKAKTTTVTCSISNRQRIWRDSKFYRKNRITKSNDSLLETSSNQAVILSPVLLRDNPYNTTFLCDLAHSDSQQLLKHHCFANEISSSNQTLIGLTVTINPFANKTKIRRYCSSKSEDLTEKFNCLCVMDTRKSCSERHLVNLTKLKTADLPKTMKSSEEIYQSEDELKFIEDCNTNKHECINIKKQQQHKQQSKKYQNRKQHCIHAQPKNLCTPSNHLSLSTSSMNNNCIAMKIRTTSLSTIPCYQNISAVGASLTRCRTVKAISTRLLKTSTFKSFDNALNITCNCENNGIFTATKESSSTDELSTHQFRGAEVSKMFAQNIESLRCCEEKTPLLDSVEMSPISPIEVELDDRKQM